MNKASNFGKNWCKQNCIPNSTAGILKSCNGDASILTFACVLEKQILS